MSSNASTSNPEKRPPTQWQDFNTRIREVLIRNGVQKPAVMQFASALKSKNADYGSWTDANILVEFRAWTPPAPKPKEPKEPKEPKAPKAPKEPKEPKEKKTPKNKAVGDETGSENSEKRPPTPWLLFVGRVRATLSSAASPNDPIFDELSSKVMKFASTLKGINADYMTWTDKSIVDEFRRWQPPPKEPKAPKAPKEPKQPKTSGSESGSTGSGKKERKKPAPKSPEEQAAINAKRAATREANKATKLAIATDDVPDARGYTQADYQRANAAAKANNDDDAAYEMALNARVAEQSAASAGGGGGPPSPVPAPRKATPPAPKKPATPSYTIEQLTNWVEIEGTPYAKNDRGDVTDEDRKFIGALRMNGTINKLAKSPADWITLFTE